jgi:CheY-like chemotaxis protein
MQLQPLVDALVVLGLFVLRIGVPLALTIAVCRWLERKLALSDEAAQERQAPKILVVDDDPDFVDLARTILKTKNYRVVSAANGKEALQVMRKDKPDLTLLDIMMSYLREGLDVCREIAADPALKDVPVIMVTSLTGTRAQAVLRSDEYIPTDEWIHKPIDPDLLLSKIDSAIRRARVAAAVA